MTHKEKILDVLADRRWHSFSELLRVYFKYTQRIFDLRKEGYVIDSRDSQQNKHALDYRLVRTPSEQGLQNDLFARAIG